MIDYFVCIGEDVLKENPNYRHLTMIGEPIIPEHRRMKNEGFYIGGSGAFHYFGVWGWELEEVVNKLLKDVNEGAHLTIKRGFRENFPKDLEQMYEKFLQKLAGNS